MNTCNGFLLETTIEQTKSKLQRGMKFRLLNYIFASYPNHLFTSFRLRKHEHIVKRVIYCPRYALQHFGIIPAEGKSIHEKFSHML